MTAGSERVEVRGMADDEVPQLLQLWEEAGWGRVPVEQWIARHRDGPHGASRVTVAVDDDGTLLGQLTMLRVGLNLRGASVPGARIFGMVMSPRFRKISGYVPLRSHPIRRMIGAAIRTAADDGAAAVYALPDKRVLRVATLAAPGATAARFPFWSRPIDPVPELPEGYEIVEGPTPADIDSVWARCRGDLVCTVRDARALAWKSLFAPLRVEGISRHGELVAVAASRAQGDRQWLVEDLLAVDDAALGAAVASVVRAAAQATAVQEIRKVGALVAPRLEPVLAACGFRADDFTFNLLVLPLDDGERGKKLEPAQWYLTPND